MQSQSAAESRKLVKWSFAGGWSCFSLCKVEFVKGDLRQPLSRVQAQVFFLWISSKKPMYLFPYIQTQECSKPAWWAVFCFHSQHISLMIVMFALCALLAVSNSLMLQLGVMEVNGKNSIPFGPAIMGVSSQPWQPTIRSFARAAPTCGDRSQI